MEVQSQTMAISGQPPHYFNVFFQETSTVIEECLEDVAWSPCCGIVSMSGGGGVKLTLCRHGHFNGYDHTSKVTDTMTFPN